MKTLRKPKQSPMKNLPGASNGRASHWAESTKRYTSQTICETSESHERQERRLSKADT